VARDKIKKQEKGFLGRGKALEVVTFFLRVDLLLSLQKTRDREGGEAPTFPRKGSPS